MLIIPAIDIIKGNCVRLTQGDFGKQKIYSKNPLNVARNFVLSGAEFLHVIDLDGAKSGKPENRDLIIELRNKINVPLQVGGGIRTFETIRDYLDAGIDRVILGTKAFEVDGDFLKKALSEFGADKIVVALDVKNGKLMVEGWLRGVDEDLEYALLRLKVIGVKYLLVTDITKDGTLKRPNFDLIRDASDFGFEVIAAGGISLEDDLRILKGISRAVVVGKALYEGRLNLGKILAISRAGNFNSNLSKRVIPCLDVKNGRVVKGVNFLNLQDAGDPVELAKIYSADGADELVFLDISASLEGRKTLLAIVEKVAREIFIPFTVGGGVRILSDIRGLLNAGADKVAVNSAAVLRPNLIREAAKQFGSQCVVVAMDVKKVGKKWKIFINSGSEETDFEVIEWAKMVEKLGAGEILLTSMDRDGTKAGFDLELLRTVSEIVKIPIIASGGAGSLQDFKMAFEKGKADAVLAASLFHFGEISIRKLKDFMNLSNISTRL